MAMVFSAERPRKWPLAGKMKQTEAPNRGRNPKECPRNLGNPPPPRARVRASYASYRRKIGGPRRLASSGEHAFAFGESEHDRDRQQRDDPAPGRGFDLTAPQAPAGRRDHIGGEREQ